jgi:hypothetical protein
LIQPLLRWKRSYSVTTSRARRALQFPIPAPSRIALLDSGFATERNTREFSADDLPAMHQWAPEAIVAPLETALTLADQKLRGVADLASLRIALIVLTSIDGEPLADDYRELFWQAFQVPVFEQLRGRDGAILARECEVHDGLHLDPAADVTPEIQIALVRDHCECGLESPRLRTACLARSLESKVA